MSKHTCDNCRHYSGAIEEWDTTPLGGGIFKRDPPHDGWCDVVREWFMPEDEAPTDPDCAWEPHTGGQGNG